MTEAIVNNVVPDTNSVNPVKNAGWNMNYNVRQVSIAYIALMVEWHTGMQPLESNMVQTANDQKIENSVMDDFIQFSSLVSQIEAEGSNTGTANALSLAKQLQAVAVKLFGTGAHFDKSGNFVPGKGSDLYAFMEVLDRNGGNAFTNPAYDQITSFAKLIFTSWTPSNINTDYYTKGNGTLPPVNTIGQDLIGGAADTADLANWVNVIGYNYYSKMNPSTGVNAGTDYAGQSYVQTSASQNAMSGINQENTAWMQTATTQDQSYDQIGQNIINSITQLIQSMNQNMRS